MTPAAIRASAARTLASLLNNQGSLASLLPANESTDPAASALLKELCFGSCRWYHQLAGELGTLMDKPLKNKDRDIACLLIIGLYQLSRLNLPDYAAINETVNACRILRKQWARSLVNGVLRSYQRRATDPKLALTYPTAAVPPEQGYSHPKWLLEALRAAWPEQWQAIAHANNERPPMTLRVNQQASQREAFLQQLAGQALAAKPGRYGSTAVYLSDPMPVNRIPGFDHGLVSVQDEASQLIPALLAPQPGHRVLDACAAPGGKTCHLLEYQPEVSQILALDIDERRLARLADNLQRLGLEHASVQRRATDATNLDHWWDGQPFDRILLDAPCSASGIIRRQPDIKLLRQPSDIERLCKLQARLLDTLWTTLKPGGIMLYSTCSVLPTENSQQITTFLSRTANAQEQTIQAPWGIPCESGRQLLPSSNGPDGFYFALIAKTS